ncbi:ATP-binding protein [Pseudomonas rhizosphaerae]|uniref:ATP-binding protein n=1 Tax=Pseudomonas rhizosphaerae TaxID=216142 RepID=UPI000A48E6E4|nr:ATP-binding protein [Pseudomonas rhizosphaerae]
MNSKSGINPVRKFHTFTVDAALLRELGERLVGKPYVALAELVKNSYDADATEVTVTFRRDSITVTDNGSGMSQTEFISHWLRVGTTHKQKQNVTSGGRNVTGSKGVGRLSVQFLGDELEVVSRKAKSHETFRADVNWDEARRETDLVKAGVYISTPQNQDKIGGLYEHGTSVKIVGLKHEWLVEDFTDLAGELWFLKPPPELLDSRSSHPFDIQVKGLNSEAKEAFNYQMKRALENWIAVIEGSLSSGRTGGSNEIVVTFKNGDEYRAKYKPETSLLDQVEFKIYIFKLSGKQAGGINVHEARDYFRKFGGIHIYDNSFRLPFYGGDEQDWLGLEIDHSHRINKSKLLPANLQVASGLNDLPTNGRIFGAVKISTSLERESASVRDLNRGAYLNVQVTRDRLIDNEAFAELKHSVRWAIDYYAMRSFERRNVIKASMRLEVPKTEEKVSEIRTQLFQLSMKVPQTLEAEVDAVSNKLKELEDLELKRTSAINEERILLAALATSGMAALAMEHELHKELSVLSDMRKQLTSKNKVLDMPKLIASIDNWADRTAKARKLFSPLMHEYDREKRNQYNAQKVLARIVGNSEALLRQVHVEIDFSRSIMLPSATFAAWNAIFQNVLINAVNAMIDSSRRLMFCFAEIDRNKSSIYIADTGVGVRLSDSSDLFKPFIRRLEIPEERKALGLGGMGIGLTIVKMVADSLDCTVSFVPPPVGFSTAFKLEWTHDE